MAYFKLKIELIQITEDFVLLFRLGTVGNSLLSLHQTLKSPRRRGWGKGEEKIVWGSRDGVVGKALVSHQRVSGSIPEPGVICGLSLLLVLYSAPRGFSPGTPVFPSPQNPTFSNSNSILEYRVFLNEFLWTPWCSVGKQIIFLHYLFTYISYKPW